MSQSQNSKDTQALVQSMLQRLKLQPGKEGQAYLHTTIPSTDATTWGQDGEKRPSSPQKGNGDVVNDFDTNFIPSKDLSISTADATLGFKDGEVDEYLISSPSQKVNIDRHTGENTVLEHKTRPGITPTETGQLFPAKSLKDADTASSGRINGEIPAITKGIPPTTDASSSMGTDPGTNQDQGFSPRVYMWSLKGTDNDPGGQESNMFHVGNGGLAETVNSSFRVKQRPSEKKTKRWTAKIKERWKDRQGSFGKKGKEEGGTADQKSPEINKISPPSQATIAENPPNTSNPNVEDRVYPVDSSEILPEHTSDSTADQHIRSTTDFDLGLGSFSLLDEIVKGQEWAKFLNPNLSASPANQTASEDLLNQVNIQTNSHDTNQSPRTSNQVRDGRNQWSFGSTDSSPAGAFNTTEVPPEAFLPVSMDITEDKQNVHREANHSEPMEDGHNSSDMQLGESRLGQFRPSVVEPRDNLPNTMLKTRGQLTRKRHHQSAERREEKLQNEKMSDGEEADRGESTSRHNAMEGTGEPQSDRFNSNSHPAPLSPSSPNPNAPAPRGVLKHSISRDSESSMETLSKRRRVEENRHVRFADAVVTIPPPVLDLDISDSEQDSEEEEEEDSVAEQEGAVEHVEMEEVAPARRPALHNWIMGLKKKNMGRKHR